MDIKNFLLKKKQVKAMEILDGFGDFIRLRFHCPKCHWGTDDSNAYITHLVNHLTKKKRRSKSV